MKRSFDLHMILNSFIEPSSNRIPIKVAYFRGQSHCLSDIPSKRHYLLFHGARCSKSAKNNTEHPINIQFWAVGICT
jgi:hypothetical protein